MESMMLAMPQAHSGVDHIFSPGLYIRQVTLKAGTIAIGHHQKTRHLNVMLSGRALMVEPDGSRVERCAPLVYVSEPGRKVGYIYEDVVWLNIYPTDETDIDKLEATYLDKSKAWENSQLLISHDRQADIADFQQVLKDLGVSEETVRNQSEYTKDQVPFPLGRYKVKVGKSSIEGLGLIATNDIRSGEVIAIARISGYRTPAGRFTNHALNPNAEMRGLENGDIELVAVRDIKGCHGGNDGEEVTVNYRQSYLVTTRQLELSR